MTRGLQQQTPGLGYVATKSAATPQHGQKPAEKPELPQPEPRSFQHRMAH
jgi:hypothetical protein